MPRKSKKSARKPDAITLAKANRFNRNALASNRQGQLASSQILWLALRLASMLFSFIVTIAFGIAWIILAALVVSQEAFAANWVSLMVAALLSVLGLFWIFDGIKHIRQQTFPLLHDVIGGRVTMEEGVVSRDYDDNSYASLWHRLFTWVYHFFDSDHDRHINAFSGVHYYVLNGQQFTVSQKGYAALTKESSCRLHYASHSKRLVNIELVPAAQALEDE